MSLMLFYSGSILACIPSKQAVEVSSQTLGNDYCFGQGKGIIDHFGPPAHNWLQKKKIP